MEDDGTFTSNEVPEIAQAMAGQWVLFRRHFRRAQSGLCDRFLRRQAELLGAELKLASENRPSQPAGRARPGAPR